MNVSLTPKLEALVKAQVASGFYNNSSEVMREALRLFFARQTAGAAGGPDRAAIPAGGPGDDGRDKYPVMARLRAVEPELRARGVSGLRLFGPILYGNSAPESPVDILVDMAAEARFDLLGQVAISKEIEGRLGRPVNLETDKTLDERIRARVLAEAERVF